MSEEPSSMQLEVTRKELESGIPSNQQLVESRRQSEAKFRLLYEKSPHSSQSLDIKGRIVDVNSMWLDSFGYSRQDVTPLL